MKSMEDESHAIAAKEIQDVLLNFGIPSSLLGFAYLTYAEELILQNPAYQHHVTKLLYVDIANKFDTTPASVERCIRKAISTACVYGHYGNYDYINVLFRNSINPKRAVPTNSQFISRVYFYLINR